ncbi:MAG: zf-HC2 domain-containing protein [Bacteroidota bacterium]|nr:zf-HC2 domain-containing protein [Bacteroidota bacterium]
MQHPAPDVLGQYADALLDAPEHDRVHRHLTTCASCRNALLVEKSLSDAVRTASQRTPSSRFDSAVLSALRRPATGPSRRIPYLGYAAAALLIVTTFVVVIIAGASGETQSRSALTPMFERITEVLTPAMELLTSQSGRLTPKLDERDSDFFRVFFIATAALLLIGGLERVLFPLMRQGHKT